MPAAGVDAGICRASAGRLCAAASASVRSGLLWQCRLLHRKIRPEFSAASGQVVALRLAKPIIDSDLGFTGLEFATGSGHTSNFPFSPSPACNRSPDLPAGLRHSHLTWRF